MRVIRHSSLAAVPWKNGGGVTREALRVPPAGDPFQWRLSVARIDTAGPFSDFAGYRRFMVLLQGAGVVLRFSRRTGPAASDDDAREGGCDRLRELRRVGDMAEFDGGLATYCELVNGPCVDLNLMVSKSLPRVGVRVEVIREARSFTVGPRQSMLVFPIDAPIDLACGEEVRLEPWDVALVSEREPRVVRIARSGGEPSAPGRLLVARLPSQGRLPSPE
jgi:environmental stress-induced protein Ves